MDSKRYNNIKLALGIIQGVLTFCLLFIFVYSGLSTKTEQYLSEFITNEYLLFLIFVIAVSLAFSIIFFPLSYYLGFYLEHKYNLSNQTFWNWIWEGIKGVLVSFAVGIPVLIFFFYIIKTYNELWWLPLAVGLFFFSVILAKIVPIIILPIFYKVVPLENEGLKNKIKSLAEQAGMKVQNIYSFNMSKNTKKANAAFTGLGSTKRILLGDTLVKNYSDDEVETIVAHELGHYKKKHIPINLLYSTIMSFVALYLISVLYKTSLPWFGFNNISQISAFPIILLWAMMIGLVFTPLSNLISRKFEYEADQYAVQSTRKKNEFVSVLEKLTEQNLGDKSPHPFVEWFFYSHPSIKRRIAAIEKYSLEKHVKSD